jgi:cellulose synthase/poly-beta-1,6-N-acetylglucosamine synthase-like glycosyltransferase
MVRRQQRCVAPVSASGLPAHCPHCQNLHVARAVAYVHSDVPCRFRTWQTRRVRWLRAGQ